ncbi:MAG: GspH/FimT family pseudopilin [Candidatus Zixiibacteriota bacterium]
MKRLLSKRGITLLELMASVVIIGILAAMAAPSFDRSVQRIKFRGETKDIVSLLRMARSEAITKKEPYGIYFDNQSKIITFFQDQANLSSYTYDAGSDGLVSVDTLPSEIVYLYATFPNSAVVFQSNGSASGSGYIYMIALSSGIVNTSGASVLASTGKSKVEFIHNY